MWRLPIVLKKQVNGRRYYRNIGNELLKYNQIRSGIINKKILFYTTIVVGMLVLLYLMTNTFWELRKALDSMDKPQVPLLKMSLWTFLFGILIEWKGLKNISQGNIRVNWLLVPAISLAIISFIPRLYWGIWFGLGNPFYIEMFKMTEIQILLTAFSGILLVRSFNKN